MTKATLDLVDIVDEANRILRTVPRTEARGQLTWTSQVLLFNSRGEVLVTKRGPGQNFPNYWEFGITETIRHGETAYDTIKRGMKEELCIPYCRQPQIVRSFILWYRNPNDQNDCKNVMVYSAVYDGKSTIDGIEIVKKEMLNVLRLEDGIAAGNMTFTPMNLKSWAFYRRAFLGRNGKHGEVFREQ